MAVIWADVREMDFMEPMLEIADEISGAPTVRMPDEAKAPWQPAQYWA